MVEDDPEDSAAIRHALEGSGSDFEITTTDSEQAFRTALDKAGWDAVLFDYVLPGTTWQRCLALTRERDPDLPFIVVSGKKGEEHVVETVRGGCNDYVVKDRLIRLAPVLEREVRQANDRREARRFREGITRQLARADRTDAIGDLAAGVAHNLNNLLTLILAGLESIPRDGAHREEISSAMNATETAIDLIQQLLSIGRRTDATRTPVRVKPVVERVKNLVRGSIPPGIHIEIGPVDTPKVRVHASALEQAVTNLVLNARDALGTSGHVKITATDLTVPRDGGVPAAPGRYVRLAVADNGPGILPEHLDRVFDPFFTTKGDIGTGLGLATVASFARDHGGWAAVESEPGRGAEFVIVLPVARS